MHRDTREPLASCNGITGLRACVSTGARKPLASRRSTAAPIVRSKAARAELTRRQGHCQEFTFQKLMSHLSNLLHYMQ